MDTFLDFWGRWLIASSVQLAILVPIVWLLVLCCRRFSARLRYALWLLVLIKALLPPFWTVPWSTANCLAEPVRRCFAPNEMPLKPTQSVEATVFSEHDETATAEPPLIFVPEIKPAVENDKEVLPTAHVAIHGVSMQTSANTVSRFPFWSMLWVAGALALWGVVLYQYGRAMGILEKGNLLENGPVAKLLDRLAKRLKVQTRPRIVLSDSVASPFLWGFFRPNIAIPAGLPGEIGPREMECILLHELVHWKRNDLFVARIELFVLGFFWFHPLVWLAVRQLRYEREAACDEAVLEKGGVDAQSYGDSLMDVLETVRGRTVFPVGFLGFLGILERKSQLRMRMEEIMFQRRRVRKIGFFGYALLLFLFFCVMPMALAQQEPKSISPKTEEPKLLELEKDNSNEKQETNEERSKKFFHQKDKEIWELMGIRYAPVEKLRWKEMIGEHEKSYPHGGVFVKEVRKDSPFDDCGVRKGDVVMGIGKWVTTNTNDLRYIVGQWAKLDGTVRVVLLRDRQPFFTNIQTKTTRESDKQRELEKQLSEEDKPDLKELTSAVKEEPEDNFATPHGRFTHIVTFGPRDGFDPRNPSAYLALTHAHPDFNRIPRGYFRTVEIEGKLIAKNLTAQPDAFRKMIESIPQLKYMETERLTKKTFEEYEKTHQQSLAPPDGGYMTPEGGFTHLVVYGPKDGFVPKNPMDYLSIVNPKLTKFGVHAGYFRSKPEVGRLIAYNLTSTPEKYQELVEAQPQLEYIRTERLTKEMFEEYEKTSQQSLPSPDGGYATPEGGFTHLIVYGPKDGFVPKNPMDYLDIVNPKLIPLGVHAGYFRSKPEGGRLIAYNLTSTPEKYQELVEAQPQLEYIRTERLTKEMFEEYEKTSQQSLPSPDGEYATPMGHYTHVVSFRPKEGFDPRNPSDLLQALNERLIKARIGTGYFRTKPFDGRLIGSICTADPEGLKNAIESTERLKYISTLRLTKYMFEEYEKKPQLSLPDPVQEEVSKPAEIRIASIKETDWFKLLDERQKKYVLWNEKQFTDVYDTENLELGEARDVFEKRWIRLLEGPEPGRPAGGNLSTYDEAVFGLAFIKSDRAAPLLLKIATEKVVKDDSHRTYAVKALGMLGDPSTVPELIPLVYHFNFNTRWEAQIALVRLTGRNFGGDAEAWGKWYNENRAALSKALGMNLTEFNSKPVDWSCGSTDEQIRFNCDPKNQKNFNDVFFQDDKR